MKYAYSTDSIRAAEAEVMAQVGDDALMQQAARGLAVACARRLRRHRGKVTGARVLVVAGPGNNGGDGLFAGARLARQGAKVFLWRILDAVHERGWAALQAAGGRELTLDEVLGWVGDPSRRSFLAPQGSGGGARSRQGSGGGARSRQGSLDLIIEAGFGIGGREGIGGDLARLAEAVRGVVDVVAVDLPSGLGVETLRAGVPVFAADATVTFGAWKPCLLAGPARAYAGVVTFVDIGLEPTDPVLEVWEALDVAAAWPFPTAMSDKYARGVVGLDAGSAAYPGAGLLALGGAVHAGTGMVRFLGPVELRNTVIAQFPNVVHGRGRCQAYLCGPGWGPGDHLADRLASRLAEGLPTVIDADALGVLPRELGENILLTPHAGELARLLGVERPAVESDPVAHVRRAADATGATVLLKGGTQYVASPGEACVRVAVPGPAWTGQAGSGDTLAGICAALLAAGLDPPTAAVAGASVQAITARSHPGPHPPQELANRLPDTIAELEWLLEETP